MASFQWTAHGRDDLWEIFLKLECLPAVEPRGNFGPQELLPARRELVNTSLFAMVSRFGLVIWNSVFGLMNESIDS